MIYCQLNANNQIITLFGNAQNPPTPPGYTEMSETDPRYTAYVSAQATLSSAMNTYNSLLAGGITLTSTGTPALNGTYSTTPTAMVNTAGIATSIANGLGLPGGGATFNYRDSSGAAHAFDAAHFLPFAAAVRDFVYHCDEAMATIAAGGTATFPSNQVTIA